MTDIIDIMRCFDNMPPSVPEATVNLIDALREYIRADHALAQELLEERQITFEQALQGNEKLQPMRDMLRELETQEVNDTLNGLLVVQ